MKILLRHLAQEPNAAHHELLDVVDQSLMPYFSQFSQEKGICFAMIPVRKKFNLATYKVFHNI